MQDAVGPLELLHALKDKSKKRADARRQKEHDEKPFRVKVVSPPPETLLDEVFNFHPRSARYCIDVGPWVFNSQCYQCGFVGYSTGRGWVRKRESVCLALPARRALVLCCHACARGGVGQG